MQTALPYELRIGVTGHRHLSDAAAVAQAVERVLDHLQDTLPAAASVPDGRAGSPRAPLHWTVVSPLAKGADRIVARVVLNRPSARLEVITPFPVYEYRRDFAAADDRAEFEELLALDPSPFELHPDLGPEGAADRQARRNEGYFEVGCRVVEAAEIIIAVWNGEQAQGRGGTGDIVQHAVERGRVVLWIDSENPAKPAQQITGFARHETQLEAIGRPITQPLPMRW